MLRGIRPPGKKLSKKMLALIAGGGAAVGGTAAYKLQKRKAKKRTQKATATRTKRKRGVRWANVRKAKELGKEFSARPRGLSRPLPPPPKGAITWKKIRSSRRKRKARS